MNSSPYASFASLAIKNALSEDFDPTARSHKLIGIFAAHTYLKVHFLTLWYMIYNMCKFLFVSLFRKQREMMPVKMLLDLLILFRLHWLPSARRITLFSISFLIQVLNKL